MSEPTTRPAPAPEVRPQTRPALSRRGTLFERMGGESVIRAVVNDFVTRVAADPAVNFTRQGHPTGWQPTPANLDRLKQRLAEFVATTAGGPMRYLGNDMVTAHRGMAITNAEFDALAGHLRAALEAHDVPRREREELLTAVASARGAIVEVSEAPPGNATGTEAQRPAATETDATAADGTPPDAATSDAPQPDAAPPTPEPAEAKPDDGVPSVNPAEPAPAEESPAPDARPDPQAPPEPGAPIEPNPEPAPLEGAVAPEQPR